jgi:hypothetical protein
MASQGRQASNQADNSAILALVDEIKTFRREQAKVDRGKQRREWITIALLVCTTGLVVWQIWEMIKVYEPVREQATAITNIFTSNREQQRAFVAFHPGPAFLVHDKDNKVIAFAFGAAFQNVGATRTSKFHAWHSVIYFEGGVPNNLDLTKPREKVDVAEGVVAPNGSVSLVPVSVTGEQGTRALKKDGTILQWGYGEYADIFEPEKLHGVRFCYVMEPAGTPAGPSTGFSPVPFRNDCNGNE